MVINGLTLIYDYYTVAIVYIPDSHSDGMDDHTTKIHKDNVLILAHLYVCVTVIYFDLCYIKRL